MIRSTVSSGVVLYLCQKRILRTLAVTLVIQSLIRVSVGFVVSSPPQPALSRTATTTATNVLSMTTVMECPPWKFRGHDVYAERTATRYPHTENKTQTKKPVVLLIHGFGCSTTYWRRTRAALEEAGHEVHALDLLGQGRSAKPGRKDGVEYSIRLWASQVDQYITEMVGLGDDNDDDSRGGVILMGNSLGSVVALSAVVGDVDVDGSGEENVSSSSSWRDQCRGICMFNCGVGLNSRNIAKDIQWPAWQRVAFGAVFAVLDTLLFRNLPLLSFLLDRVVTAELLNDALISLYRVHPEHVDGPLVESFLRPAKDEGAVEALSQIYVNDPGATPMELHARDNENSSPYHKPLLGRSVPIHLVWGDDDVVTPLRGGVGQFYRRMADDDQEGITMDVVRGGHVPFDDNPEESHESMLRWLETVAL